MAWAEIIQSVQRAVLWGVGEVSAGCEEVILWAAMGNRLCQVSLGPVKGEKGTVVAVEADPQFLFRADMVIVVEGEEIARIGEAFVGARPQNISRGLRPTFNISAKEFKETPHMPWTPCRPGQKITLHVQFIEDGVFHAVLLGPGAF